MTIDVFEAQAVVIGAGVVGLACAAELARRGLEPLVIERESLIGSHTSSRNSEVVHAGIYYPTDSLKHTLCIEGRRRLYAYAETRGLPIWRCGKLIVATTELEDEGLAGLMARAEANGVEDMRLMSGAQAMALEPALRCTSALESGSTGVVDSHAFMLALLGEVEDGGGALALETSVEAIDLDGPHIEIFTGGVAPTRLRTPLLVNAAGLFAPEMVGRMDGYGGRLVRPRLAKGSYFSCAGRAPFRRLIYPAPVDGGLGVHLTLDLAGAMRFGPDVEWLDETDPNRVDYNVDIRRADGFYEAIRRYWPGLPDGALSPAYSGCRPKLSGPGEPAADFLIDDETRHGRHGLINLLGIESPGLTSALAIATRVADRLAEQGT